MTSGDTKSTAAPVVESVGTRVEDKISVELSTRFLHHFSEQLYSSPQKAFEELISNGWDAGADYVDVRVSADLASPGASLCVLDNGVSMDLAVVSHEVVDRGSESGDGGGAVDSGVGTSVIVVS